MKTLITSLLILIFSCLSSAQSSENVIIPKNSIIITPLGDLLNNSKSSIYFRRVLIDNSEKYLSLRVGTELFNSIEKEFSSGKKEESSSRNFKSGLEIGKRVNKMIVYFGPEINYTASKTNGALLYPTGDAIFSTQSVIVEEWRSIDKAKMSVFSMIGFIGFKYKLTNSLLIGLESAVGVGWYRASQVYDNGLFSKRNGVIKDLSVSRFILLEYCF